MKAVSCLFFLTFVLHLISCNKPAKTTEKSVQDTTQVATTHDTPSMPAYDPALDPFNVSGTNAKLLGDTLGMKLFEWWINPGELLPLHTHPDHAVYVLEGGKAMVYSNDIPGAEKGMPIELQAGQGWIGGMLSDSARNIGTTVIRVVEVDVYRPRNEQ